MRQSIGQVAIVVRDYDEALEFYVGVLGFNLIEDTPIPTQSKRWVVVAPPGAIFAHTSQKESHSSGNRRKKNTER
jgi:catechol 2,3-dioxygenase-like lactoylglutathione lyase family enzyme